LLANGVIVWVVKDRYGARCFRYVCLPSSVCTPLCCQVSARLRSCPGRPGEVVCHLAVEENAAFIVIGTHGTSALKRTVLGSVSNHIVRHAHCPVIVCRDPAEIQRQRQRHDLDSSATTAHFGLTHQVSEPAVSGGKERHRHRSGEAFTTFASGLRRRFASGGGSRAAASRSVDDSGLHLFETSTVLFSASQEISSTVATDPLKTDVPNPAVLRLRAGD